MNTETLHLAQFWGIVAIAVAGGTVISILGLRRKSSKTADYAIRGIATIVKALLAAFVAASLGWSTMAPPFVRNGSDLAAATYSITA